MRVWMLARCASGKICYLTTRLGRFEFVFTPKYGSWLNLIESFFVAIHSSPHMRKTSQQGCLSLLRSCK